MTLNAFLKQFKNICWYPSAGKDALSMVCFSYESLRRYGISKDEVPDCFIFTDYTAPINQGTNRFFLDLVEYENQVSFYDDDLGFAATAFNVKELNKLKLSFDRELVHSDKDEYYGRVFIADILVEHPQIGKNIAKLIYVIAENTAFAFDFLLKNNVKVEYMIHSCYGYGFGGGISTGEFICHIFKELGTKYFASDMDGYYNEDVSDKYLSDEQRHTVPILKRIDDFTSRFGWQGYGNTVFYEVKSFEMINNDTIEEDF